MKLEYTKDYFINSLKRLDTRAERLEPQDFDIILNNGFAEMSTVGAFYSGEEIVSMAPFYGAGELKFTLDIEEDVTMVYDYYLTVENQPYALYEHGIKRIQDNSVNLDKTDINSMYLDARYIGRVHIDLSQVPANTIIDNAVIKYMYTPQSTSSTYYMDQQVRLATESAMASAMYDFVSDVPRSSQKRAAMERQANAILNKYPEDFTRGKPSMFPVGV